MAKDPETRAHQEWLGPLQPVGLVVSPPALVKAQVVVARNAVELQRRLRGLLEDGTRLPAWPVLATGLLDWEAEDLVTGEALPPGLEVALPEHQEVLRPTHAVADPDREGGWLMLVQELREVDDVKQLDQAPGVVRGQRGGRGWHASPQIKLERLLRDTGVPLGLLCTPVGIRMVVAPAGESSGHMTFPAGAMAEVAGRTILAALHMLLCAERVFTLPPGRRLAAIVVESRKYQNVVSTQLAEQVLRALGELLRGFQAADEATEGRLLGEVVREDPQHVYGGLITVLMRLVFLLYAEEREMLPGDDVYVRHYSVGGLFERLRADAGLYPDTMDQRYGAWAQLLSLFRLVFDGGGHGGMWLPAREGQLFRPDEYPFLEGRQVGSAWQRFGAEDVLEPPKVSDGVVLRVLEDLLMLDGERLSYRSLDVEQIGSVYEAVMGFEVKRTVGASIGVRPQHVVVDLEGVLKAKGAARGKVFEEAGCKLGKAAAEAVKAAVEVGDVVEALGKKVSPQTPRVLPVGSLYLQPTEERRRSGSHYTPRSLTEPIVRTTLRPVLEGLARDEAGGEGKKRVTAEDVLGLKVCDPAMGSGAFLVEACRHLAEKVVEAWEREGDTPEIPADEDLWLHARRLVAQRCLYGVDKNPFAVNLAKLSLWLVTLARDHAFTFLDHALKCGDSLVGLTRRQIAAFHWKVEEDEEELPLFKWVTEQVGRASACREDIVRLGDGFEAEKRVHLREADEALAEARLTGDLVIAAYFTEENAKSREARRLELHSLTRAHQDDHQGHGTRLRKIPISDTGIRPFHWEIEFPEVFDRGDPGFDAFTGNPPFLGGTMISSNLSPNHLSWIKMLPESGDRADLAAYFFRLAFDLLRTNGCLGFVATNTIAQGDTRTTGLGWIRKNGGTIYSAERRHRWPGLAAVIVSIVHIGKGRINPPFHLEGNTHHQITSFLLSSGGEEEPQQLQANNNLSYEGFKLAGQGFLFSNSDDGASPTSALQAIVARKPEYLGTVIMPYLGGHDLTTLPDLKPRRYTIYFGTQSLDEASHYSELLEIVRVRVKPQRDQAKRPAHRLRWWQYGEVRPGLVQATRTLTRVLATPRVSNTFAFVFLPSRTIYNEKIVVFPLEEFHSFGLLQSRTHELWARAFSSTLKDDLQYTPSACFATFPFPRDHVVDAEINEVSRHYYETRAAQTQALSIGLTPLYRRFHDPDETSPDILRLRELHDAMDRAVLDAYGWTDIQPRCEFLLDYEEDEDEESSSRRRKPWRYRWPDEIQEEVLARLLDLNQKRAEEERLAGVGSEGGKSKGKKATKGAKKARGKKTAKKAASAQLTTTPSEGGDGEWKSGKKKSGRKKPKSGNLELLPRDDK